MPISVGLAQANPPLVNLFCTCCFVCIFCCFRGNLFLEKHSGTSRPMLLPSNVICRIYFKVSEGDNFLTAILSVPWVQITVHSIVGLCLLLRLLYFYFLKFLHSIFLVLRNRILFHIILFKFGLQTCAVKIVIFTHTRLTAYYYYFFFSHFEIFIITMP